MAHRAAIREAHCNGQDVKEGGLRNEGEKGGGEGGRATGGGGGSERDDAIKRGWGGMC